MPIDEIVYIERTPLKVPVGIVGRSAGHPVLGEVEVGGASATDQLVLPVGRWALGATTAPDGWTPFSTTGNIWEQGDYTNTNLPYINSNPKKIDLSQAGDKAAPEAIYQSSASMGNQYGMAFNVVNICTPGNAYTMRLHFCEPSTPMAFETTPASAGDRPFTIAGSVGTNQGPNGGPPPPAFDTFAATGGLDIAYVVERTFVASDVSFNVRLNYYYFNQMPRTPSICGIELLDVTKLATQSWVQGNAVSKLNGAQYGLMRVLSTPSGVNPWAGGRLFIGNNPGPDLTTIAANSLNVAGYCTAPAAQFSFAMGAATTNSIYSFAGNQAWINQNCDGSFAWGNSVAVNPPAQTAFAFGQSLQANGRYSAVFGWNNQSWSTCEFVMGFFNELSTAPAQPTAYPSSTDTALVIGNGTAWNARSNCFKVTFGGDVYAGPSGDKPLATQEWVLAQLAARSGR